MTKIAYRNSVTNNQADREKFESRLKSANKDGKKDNDGDSAPIENVTEANGGSDGTKLVSGKPSDKTLLW